MRPISRFDAGFVDKYLCIKKAVRSLQSICTFICQGFWQFLKQLKSSVFLSFIIGISKEVSRLLHDSCEYSQNGCQFLKAILHANNMDSFLPLNKVLVRPAHNIFAYTLKNVSQPVAVFHFCHTEHEGCQNTYFLEIYITAGLLHFSIMQFLGTTNKRLFQLVYVIETITSFSTADNRNQSEFSFLHRCSEDSESI